MNYRIDWVENKSADWKVATVTDLTGKKLENVSVNRTNKKGEVFPNFDSISPGAFVEAELWTSDAGKNYLFAPRAKSENKPQGGAYKSSGVAKAQERKAEYIEKAQDNKELGIKISSTIRMAVDLAIAERLPSESFPEQGELKDRIKSWREWLWRMWDVDSKDMPPF